MPHMVRSSLRNAFAVFRRRARAVKVSRHAAYRAPVDRDTQSCLVGNVLAGDERVETDAAGGWLRPVTVIIGPLMMREWNSQPFPYLLLLSGGSFDPIERSIVLPFEKGVDKSEDTE